MFLTLLQSGGAGPGVITGALAATESGADVFSAEGLVRISGVMFATEQNLDIFSAEGVAQVLGNSGGEYITVFRRRSRL